MQNRGFGAAAPSTGIEGAVPGPTDPGYDLPSRCARSCQEWIQIMSRSEFRHLLVLPVRWGDMDSFGHVNNVQYIRYLESGRVAYLEEVMGAGLEERRIILADIQCSFLQQLHYPVTLEVGTRVSRLGRSSLHLRSAIFRQGEEQPVATSAGVMVWYDFTSGRSEPIPDEIRERIRRFEHREPEY